MNEKNANMYFEAYCLKPFDMEIEPVHNLRYNAFYSESKVHIVIKEYEKVWIVKGKKYYLRLKSGNIFFIDEKIIKEYFKRVPTEIIQIKNFTEEESCNKFLQTLNPNNVVSVTRDSASLYLVEYKIKTNLSWEDTFENESKIPF